jgi:hypothetical protein
MEKRIVRLTESDLEKLVKRIIKEGENNPIMDTPKEEGTIDIKDVQNFMNMLDQYFLTKAPGKSASKRINNNLEKAGLIAAMMDKFGVDVNLVSKAKNILKQSSQQ